MTKDKKLESNYDKLLDSCRGYGVSFGLFMGVIAQEISWMEDCIKTYTQGVDERAGQSIIKSIIKSRKLIDSMLPVVETIINTEDKSSLLNTVIPNIEADTAFMNYKIHSSIMGMYNNMVNSVNLLEKCKIDETCTCDQRRDAEDKIR